MPYYSNLEKWFNLYYLQLGVVGSCGNTFNNIKLTGIVHHDDCVFKDGVCSGSDITIYMQWMTGSDCEYTITISIKLQLWIHVKRVKNICNNHKRKKRGEEGYDPCYKFY